MPAAVGEGNLDGYALEDIGRRWGLTLDAAERFRKAWNEASRSRAGSPQWDRAMDIIGDIEDDPKNWQAW